MNDGRPLNPSPCPFCDPDAELVFFQDKLMAALWDRCPYPRRRLAEVLSGRRWNAEEEAAAMNQRHVFATEDDT